MDQTNWFKLEFFAVLSLLSKAQQRWRSLPTGKIRPERTTITMVTIWSKLGVPPTASLVNKTPCSPLPSRTYQSLLDRLRQRQRRGQQQWLRYHHKFLLRRPRLRSLQNLSQALQLLHRKWILRKKYEFPRLDQIGQIWSNSNKLVQACFYIHFSSSKESSGEALVNGDVKASSSPPVVSITNPSVSDVTPSNQSSGGKQVSLVSSWIFLIGLVKSWSILFSTDHWGFLIKLLLPF